MLEFEQINSKQIASETKTPLVNLGGEGEIPDAINVNLPCILHKDWRASRDGAMTLRDIQRCGPVVICESNKLPFKANSVNVECLNSPIGDYSTHIGPAYPLEEICRIATPPSFQKLQSNLVPQRLFLSCLKVTY